MMLAGARRLGRVTLGETVFLCCDIQERFRDVILEFSSVCRTSKLLLDGARVLEVPVVVTEQYPRGLLHTAAELDVRGEASGDVAFPVFEKTLFSMCTPQVLAHLGGLNVKSAVIFGMETHVCVQQTTLDLLEQGYDVHVVVDGVSSSRALDRTVALSRLQASGAFVTSAESVLFSLLRDKNTPKFKQISALVKAYGREPSALSAC